MNTDTTTTATSVRISFARKEYQCDWYLGDHRVTGYGRTKALALWDAIHTMLRYLHLNEPGEGVEEENRLVFTEVMGDFYGESVDDR